MKEAKLECWKKFCALESSRNPWGIVYKICRNHQNFNKIITSISTINGHTRTTLETATVFTENFFPNELQDDELQMQTRRDVIFPPYSDEDVKFSKEELENVITAQNDNRAPGMDAISANIVKNV